MLFFLHSLSCLMQIFSFRVFLSDFIELISNLIPNLLIVKKTYNSHIKYITSKRNIAENIYTMKAKGLGNSIISMGVKINRKIIDNESKKKMGVSVLALTVFIVVLKVFCIYLSIAGNVNILELTCSCFIIFAISATTSGCSDATFFFSPISSFRL